MVTRGRSSALWLAAAGLMAGLAGGCAATGLTVPLPPLPDVSPSATGPLVTVLTFRDHRAIKPQVGMTRNGFGVETGPVYADQNIHVWLRKRLAVELRAAGFQVVAPHAGAGAAVLEGHTLKFFSEPVLHWTAVDVETDLSVRLTVTRPDGLEAQRRYYVKGLSRGPTALEQQYTPSIRRATDVLVKQIVVDLLSLWNQFPEHPASP